MKVCIVSEGSYPVIRGGLSEWAHMLIKTLRDVQFDVFCIVPYDEPQKPIYDKLPNVDQIVIKPILRAKPFIKPRDLSNNTKHQLSHVLRQMATGESLQLEGLLDPKQQYPIGKQWLASHEYWDATTTIYDQLCPAESIRDFFWSVFGFSTIMMDSLNFVNEMPRADIYHSLSAGFAGYAASLVKNIRHKPLITTEQGLYLVERRAELARADVSELYRLLGIKFAESLVRTTYRYTDMLVPPCYIPHTEIEKNLGADPNKIRVIQNGIELERFTPGNRNGDEVVVGCFARIVPIKGITDLIKAAKIVNQRKRVEFVVLGEVQDKAYHQECLTLAKELGVSDYFKMVGHVNAAEWYHKVDIFTLSSLSEGVPYSLLEAMSSGLPSVCTAVGGIPEIVTEGVGFLVQPGHPEQLAEKLGLLAENRELCREMGQRAIKVAHERFALSQMAARFRTLYKELVK